MRSCRQAARLSDDVVEALVEVEGSVNAFFVTLRDQRINFQAVSFGIEKIARHRIAHFFVRMADAVIDRYAERFEAFVVILHVSRRIHTPGDMGNDFGIALASFREGELMILDFGSGVRNTIRPGYSRYL